LINFSALVFPIKTNVLEKKVTKGRQSNIAINNAAMEILFNIEKK